MKRVLPLLPVACLFFIFSCLKEKDEEEGITPTPDNLVGVYQVEKITSVVGSTELDITSSQLQECERDDHTVLSPDQLYSYLDMGVHCDPLGGDLGSWQLVAGDSLNLNGKKFAIRKFTGSRLQVSDKVSGIEVVFYFQKI